MEWDSMYSFGSDFFHLSFYLWDLAILLWVAIIHLFFIAV